MVSDTGFAVEVDNYGVDLFATSKEQITAYKAAGVSRSSAPKLTERNTSSVTFPVECMKSGVLIAATLPRLATATKELRALWQAGPIGKSLSSVADDRWLDIHSPSCVENIHSVLKGRIELAQVGVELSKLTGRRKAVMQLIPITWTPGLTSWIMASPVSSVCILLTTADDQYAHLTFLATTAHEHGLGITLKNAGKMIKEHPDVVDS
jgi:hypothetical protein